MGVSGEVCGTRTVIPKIFTVSGPAVAWMHQEVENLPKSAFTGALRTVTTLQPEVG